MSEENVSTANEQESKTFSQEDVNRIVAERIARQENKFEGFEDFKAKAEEYETYKAEEQTRLESAKAEGKAEGEQAMKDALNAQKINHLIALNAKGVFMDPEDAHLHLKDRVAEFITEDGEVDEGAVDKALAELLEAKPHLKASKNAPTFVDAGLGKGGSSPKASNADVFNEFFKNQVN